MAAAIKQPHFFTPASKFSRWRSQTQPSIRVTVLLVVDHWKASTRNFMIAAVSACRRRSTRRRPGARCPRSRPASLILPPRRGRVPHRFVLRRAGTLVRARRRELQGISRQNPGLKIQVYKIQVYKIQVHQIQVYRIQVYGRQRILLTGTPERGLTLRSGHHEAVFFVEADRAGIVGVDARSRPAGESRFASASSAARSATPRLPAPPRSDRDSRCLDRRSRSRPARRWLQRRRSSPWRRARCASDLATSRPAR